MCSVDRLVGELADTLIFNFYFGNKDDASQLYHAIQKSPFLAPKVYKKIYNDLIDPWIMLLPLELDDKPNPDAKWQKVHDAFQENTQEYARQAANLVNALLPRYEGTNLIRYLNVEAEQNLEAVAEDALAHQI